MKVIQQLALLSATTLFAGVSAKVGAGSKEQNGPEERDLFWNPPAKPVGQPNKYQELTCTIGGPVIYTELLLEYASPFDDTFCASVPALEAEFVESYNTLARLHCDSKCHRRAVKAKFVTKFCGGGEKDDKKKKKSKKGKRERELAETLSSDNTVIVLLELDQKVPEPGSKGCSSALDAADSDKAFQSESEYSSICGFPARDHEYYDDKYYLGKEDFKSYAEYYYYKNVDGFCCCVNGSDQDLSETDLLTIFLKYTTLGALPHAWKSISELEPQAMCDASTDKFGDFLYRASYERVILTEYSSKEPIFIPHTLDALTTVITELYNGFSLDGCDKFGRQIFDAKTETVYASSEGMLNPLMPTFDSTHYGDGAGQCGGYDDPNFLPGQAVARFHCPGDVCRVCECDQDIVVTATGVLCVDPPARRLGATGQAENLEYAPHAYVKAFFQSAGVDRSQATKVAVKEEEVKHQVASENAKSEEARHEEDDERDLQVGNGSILYANDFPQGRCQGGACTKTQAFVRADCKSNICPGNADFCMICETGLRDDIFSVRRLEGETHSFEVDFGPDGRMLSFWDSVMHYDTTLDMIFDKCLCLAHERKSFTLTDVSTFTTHFANEIKGKREFWGIGLPKNVTEYVPFPVAGPNDDKHLTVPVYFEGKLCDKNDQISYDRIDELLLLIARSYNDMVIEDCDWPLFRQMVEVGLDTKFDDYIHKFYCAQAEFQFNVVLTHRCHGTCKPSLEDRLFAQGYLTGHKWQTRHLKAGKTGSLGEDTRMTLKQDPPRSSRDVVEAADSEPASKMQERELYYAPTVEGLCSLEKLYDPMPPTLDGWATNANTFAPDHVKYVDILFGQPQLCRCEFKGEYLYKSGYVSKDKLQVWNGFPVIPMSDPFCKDEYTTPVPYAADPHYFTAQLFYCRF